MKRPDRFFLALSLILSIISVLAFSALGQEEGKGASSSGSAHNTGGSHNGIDPVAISKITPRTSACVPVKSTFPISLSVSAELKTSKSGAVKIGAFLWSPGGGAGKGAYKKGLTPLCKAVTKPVKNGKNAIDLSLPPVTMPADIKPNTQVVTVVSLQNEKGKEVAWNSSYNFIRGEMILTKTSRTSPRDVITVLSYSPKAGDLAVGTSHQFTYKFQYSLKSRDYAFVNFELGDAKNDLTVGPWHCAAIPVPKGSGIVKFVSDPYFFPYALKFLAMRLSVHYRVKPLSGTENSLFYGDWNLVAP